MIMKTLAYIAYITSTCIWIMLWKHEVLFIVLTSAMLFDTLFGVLKSLRLKNFNSWTLWRWAVSKLAILSFILFIWIVWTHAYPALQWNENVIWWLFWILLVAEIISILQNIIVIKTWEHIEEYDAVTDTLRFIHKTIIGILKEKIK